MVISWGGYMQRKKLIGFTGLDLFIGDELSTSSGLGANMHIKDHGSPDANLRWLLSVCENLCRIAIFCFHYLVSPSAYEMLSVQ